MQLQVTLEDQRGRINVGIPSFTGSPNASSLSLVLLISLYPAEGFKVFTNLEIGAREKSGSGNVIYIE